MESGGGGASLSGCGCELPEVAEYCGRSIGQVVAASEKRSCTIAAKEARLCRPLLTRRPRG